MIELFMVNLIKGIIWIEEPHYYGDIFSKVVKKMKPKDLERC